MTENPRVETVLRLLLLVLSGTLALTFAISAVSRLAWPFELEWMESGMLQHVARVRAGLPLYGPPRAGFASTIYPPLYHWLGAAASLVTGVGMAAPRLVSILATIGTALLLGRMARRSSGNAWGGVTAAALLLGGYVPTGTVYDLARLDALWVFLLLAATAAAERARRVTTAVLCGALLALATATKQPAALWLVLLAAVTWWRSRSLALWMAATWTTLTGLLYGALHVLSDGWSTTYLVGMALRQPHRASALLHLLRDDLLATFGLGALVLVAAALLRRSGVEDLVPSAAWLAGAAAAVAATLATRTLQGGNENTLLPAVAFGALLVGHVAGTVLRSAPFPARVALLAALVLQLLRLSYNPLTLVPSAQDRERALAFLSRVERLPGEVWIPSHTSYAFLAGKPFLVHRDPLLDLVYTGAGFFPEDLLLGLRQRRFSAVIVDGPFVEQHIQSALEDGYARAEVLDRAPELRLGYRTSPREVWLPR